MFSVYSLTYNYWCGFFKRWVLFSVHPLLWSAPRPVTPTHIAYRLTIDLSIPLWRLRSLAAGIQTQSLNSNGLPLWITNTASNQGKWGNELNKTESKWGKNTFKWWDFAFIDKVMINGYTYTYKYAV